MNSKMLLAGSVLLGASLAVSTVQASDDDDLWLLYGLTGIVLYDVVANNRYRDHHDYYRPRHHYYYNDDWGYRDYGHRRDYSYGHRRHHHDKGHHKRRHHEHEHHGHGHESKQRLYRGDWD